MSNEELKRIKDDYQLSKGDFARLIPAIADSKKEERATSVVLAAFMIVPEFARSVLELAGAPWGKRTKIQCLTEVSFKSKDLGEKRPDGLIILSSGSKKWTALVESKIGRSGLDKSQVEDYLDIAKSQGIDAVITISNQFATIPTHHPISVSKVKTRNIGLFHFSWLAIIAESILILDKKTIDDIEQAYILRELYRYLNHDGSGVKFSMAMPSEWKNLTNKVFEGVHLTKTDIDLEIAVGSWHQLQKYLALQLSIKLGTTVKTKLVRAHAKDPASRLEDSIKSIQLHKKLSSTFIIPNAAGDIELTADIYRKSLTIMMSIEAPKDRHRATASINWLTRQLRAVNQEGMLIRAKWPKRIPATVSSVQDATENPEKLVPHGSKEVPTSFELTAIIDLGAKFKSGSAFVEIVEHEILEFYKRTGEHLVKWTPKPPKIKVKTTNENNSSAVESHTETLSRQDPEPNPSTLISNSWIIKDL
jgi:hypothetical protein